MDSTPTTVATPTTAEKMFIIFVLVLSTGAFLNLTITPGQHGDEASGMVAFPAL
jgi:predicted deacylase